MSRRLSERDRLLDVLDLKEVDRPPCVSPLQTGTVELMELSQAYWPRAHSDPVQMAALSLAAHDHAGLEGVRVPFDITVDASAFQTETGLATMDRQPSLSSSPLASIEELGGVTVPDPYRSGRATVVLEAVARLSDQLEDIPIICGLVGPFMLMAQLRGAQEALMEVVTRPTRVLKTLELAARWNVLFVKAALEAGADTITIVDATASGDILSPEQYRQFALPYHRMMTDEVHRRGGRAILHICGDTERNLDHMLRSGADGISIDQKMDIRMVKERLRGRVATIGNIDPVRTLLFSTPERTAEETIACLEACVDVLSPGCGLAPRTPTRNLKAMVQAVKAWHSKG